MIEIKITYGTDTAAEAPTLRKLAAALLVLAGDNAVAVTAASSVANAQARRPEQKTALPALDLAVGGPVQGSGGPGWTIAPNDVPDVGAEIEEEIDPAAIFGHGSAALDADAAKLEALAGPGAAGPTAAEVFGGNAQGATSPTPSGTPAAPNSGAVTGGVSVDSRGLPWDGRIHAGTKTTNKDGTWKKKPNVDPALVAQVETELRAVMAIPAPNAQPAPIDFAALVPAGAPATPPVVVPPPPLASAPGNVPTPTPPASAPTTAAGVASNPIANFAQLLPAVTNALASGRITEQDVANVLAQHGVAVLPQLAPRPDLVQSVAASLGL